MNHQKLRESAIAALVAIMVNPDNPNAVAAAATLLALVNDLRREGKPE